MLVMHRRFGSSLRMGDRERFFEYPTENAAIFFWLLTRDYICGAKTRGGAQEVDAWHVSTDRAPAYHAPSRERLGAFRIESCTAAAPIQNRAPTQNRWCPIEEVLA
jgi:hypothetical protein